MSATHKNTVDTLLKRSENMMGRHATGARDPNNPDICRILHTTDPSQVSSGIRSPGAKKCDDMGFEFGIAHLCLSLSEYFLLTPHQAAQIWANRCSGLYPPSRALWEGQAEAQFPQPLHKILFTWQTRVSRL